MDKRLIKFALPAIPRLLPAGKKLRLVNIKGTEIGEVILKDQTDVMMSFSQENESGKMVRYKITFCDLFKGEFYVQEIGSDF
ncbi:MAG: hypothetical protein PHE24_00310 [Patescibacteria group bacterium]|nr:hypothetical protein [Patescibacteria group bacterium]